MALTNVIQLPTTSHSTTRYGNGSVYYYGSEGNVYDNDVNTYIGVYNIFGDGGNSVYTDSYHTWTTPVTIQSVSARIYSENLSYGNYANRAANPLINQQLFVRIGGSWTSIWQYIIYNPGGDGAPNYSITSTPNVSGPWSNVTGIRAYCAANSYAYEGARRSDCFAYLYDLKAFKTTYADIGIRVKTPTTIQPIGTDPLESTHSLRVSKNGVTYGIPLLSTSDENASTVRIRKGSTTYALPKVVS